MEVDFWNYAEIEIFSELVYTSAEFRKKCQNSIEINSENVPLLSLQWSTDMAIDMNKT
jgi:hypothetical protein